MMEYKKKPIKKHDSESEDEDEEEEDEDEENKEGGKARPEQYQDPQSGSTFYTLYDWVLNPLKEGFIQTFGLSLLKHFVFDRFLSKRQQN